MSVCGASTAGTASNGVSSIGWVNLNFPRITNTASPKRMAGVWYFQRSMTTSDASIACCNAIKYGVPGLSSDLVYFAMMYPASNPNSGMSDASAPIRCAPIEQASQHLIC